MPFRRKKTTRSAPAKRTRKTRPESLSRAVRRLACLPQRVRQLAQAYLAQRARTSLAAQRPRSDGKKHEGKCYFAADLHLFANRSKGARHWDEMRRKAAQAEVFVLGGDIFDFRWARTQSHHHTIEKASAWLMALAESCPRCHFHYVLGNHDYHRKFIEQLCALDAALPNFSWHRYYVRLGNSVFLHGDVADGEGATAESLAAAREIWLDVRRRGPWASSLYDAVVLARLHKSVPHLVYTKRLIAHRVSVYLERIGQGPAAGVRNVYFGHTHKPMVNYHYGRLAFHNGGAPIKGMKFRILDARTD